MSLLKLLLENDSSVTNNIALESAINRYEKIKEQVDILPINFKHSVLSTVVVETEQAGNTIYAIELDSLYSLMKDQEMLNVDEVFGELLQSITLENSDVKISDIALVVKDEDPEELEKIIEDEDEETQEEILNNVLEYTKLLNGVKSLGVKILVDRK